MMKPILALLFTLAAAFPASAAERRYSVTDFDRIFVEGPFEVTLATGRPSAATAFGTGDSLDRISVEVQGGTLRIRPVRSASSSGTPPRATGKVKLEIATRSLRSAVVAGPGSLAVDKAGGLRIEIGLEGSGRISVGEVKADLLVLASSGSGQVSLGGEAKQLRATLRGSGSLDAAGLKAGQAEIASETAGDVRLAVTREAKVTSLGAGEIDIIGTPACTVRAAGSGPVRCGRSDQGQTR